MNATRVQTGVRMEKRLVKVLKALAELRDLSLGDLLEYIVRAGFAGEFTCTSERAIGDQSVAHSLDGVVALVRRQRGQPPTSLISEYENTILMCD